MEKNEKFQRPRSAPPFFQKERGLWGRGKIGRPEYINENCWLVKALNYSPAKRCQYCKLRFHNCLFFQYLIISLILTFFFLSLSLLIERKISELLIVSIFTLVIVYGYFFNQSTDKIIKANFAQRKAKMALEELNEKLKEKIDEKTKKLQRVCEKLMTLNKAKSEFISIASHQLRTPLTVIKGYISMMLEKIYGNPPKKMKKPLESIYASNERLIKLVNDFLSLSKLEAKKIEFNPELTSLKEIVLNVVKELKINAEKKGLYIKIVKPVESLPKVIADKDKLRQVILNIIDNAIKYTKKGGITIELKKLDFHEQIKISDTGEGIDKEEKRNLFQIFSRATTSTHLNTQGVGVGLYVAKKFIEMHNGKIWIKSPGRGKGGSIFYIELPITKTNL